MARYIDADALFDTICSTPSKSVTDDPFNAMVYVVQRDAEIFHIIKDAPTADVAPVRHGTIKHIVYHNGCTPDEDLVCSVCEKSVLPDYNYCPNCGAKMDGGENE